MKAFGATVELPDEKQFEVWEENWEAAILFLRLSTQWRTGGFGGFFGLDYSAVNALFRIERVKNQRAVFADLQTMEHAAISVLNKKAD